MNEKGQGSFNDVVLINNIKKNINVDASLKLLDEMYSGVYYKMVHYYFSHPALRHQKEDLVRDCYYYIYLAAKDFDFNKKTKFSSYLGNRARWACLTHINKNKKNCVDLEFNSDILNKENEENFHSKLLDKETFELFFSDLKVNDQIYKIFKLRYLEGSKNKLMPWREIGKQLNLSIQGCINIHDRFLKKIKKLKKYDK